jgi:hypothetical protein
MDLDAHAASIAAAPAPAVQPGTVMVPGASSIVAAAANFSDAADNPKLQA